MMAERAIDVTMMSGGCRAVEEDSVTAVLRWGVGWCHCECNNHATISQKIDLEVRARTVQLRSEIALAVTPQRGIPV